MHYFGAFEDAAADRTTCESTLAWLVLQIGFVKSDSEEDHFAAIMFDAQALTHVGQTIDRRVLPTELDDMPKYEASGV